MSTTFTFTNDGGTYDDEAGCAACGESPADTELAINGRLTGYVCLACLKAVHEGGLTAWKSRLRDRAIALRTMADLCDENGRGIDPDGNVEMKLAVMADAFGDFTALGRGDDSGEANPR